MSNEVKYIPEGFHSVTPYISVRGGAEAIEFYKKAFGAKERYRFAAPDGKKVGHAEITIGDSIVMLADEMEEYGNKSPKSLNGTPVNLCVYVQDVDEAFKRAVEAGAKVVRPVTDMFYGDRTGCIEDPFGHTWSLMTHKEDVPPEELNRRMQAECAKTGEAPKGS